MGCLAFARIAEASMAMTLVDIDEARLAALRERGLILRDDESKRLLSSGNVRGSARAAGRSHLHQGPAFLCFRQRWRSRP
ncbi:hypothetical protein [Sphingomonas sp. MMS24-J13]|uniref:hypothetical protein n=1 Tax=Sphingomonas sp. MMS24-J13 TaxID=3238686 RepID=UPI00384B276D